MCGDYKSICGKGYISMPKSAIIKELANGEISLEVALNRLLLIASDICNDELKAWAQRELTGYNDTKSLPEYRKATGGYLRYSGINGSYLLENSPLQLGFLSEESRKIIEEIDFFDGIVSLEKIANEESNSNYIRDLTVLASEIYENSNGEINCTSIQQVIPRQMYQDMLTKIKTKIVDILIALEKEYGCLDSLDIDATHFKKKKMEEINRQINCEIYNDSHITIGDRNKISKSIVGNLEVDGKNAEGKWYSKIVWKIVVPVVVGLIVAFLVWRLGI